MIYHTIATLEDGKFCPQWGSYDLSEAKQERLDMIENGDYTARQIVVVTSGDAQTAIDQAVKELNIKKGLI